MRPLRFLVVLGAALAVGLAACIPFSGFVYDQRLGGPYRLVAVDSMEDMGVCRDFPGERGGDCIGDGLPGPTVFAAGIDDHHLVIARVVHEPFMREPSPNEGAIEYYYVIRAPDEAQRFDADNVIGPLSRSEFLLAKDRLGLPEFSHEFDELGRHPS